MRRFILAAMLTVCAARPIVAQEKDSDPKSAARAFAQALIEGDADEAKTYFDGDDDSKQLIEPMAAASIAYKKAAEAAVTKFGEEARTVYGKDRNSIFLQKIENSEEVFDGDDKAMLDRRRVKGDPIRLRKVDGAWKIYKLPDAVINARKEITAMTQALETVAKEIEDGEFKTALDSHDAIKAKTREFAATQPTTRP